MILITGGARSGKSRHAEALTRAVEGMGQRLAARVARGKLTADQADALVSRLVPVTELAALSDAWLVIEAVSERPDVKKALFNQLAAICSPLPEPPSTMPSEPGSAATASAAGMTNFG